MRARVADAPRLGGAFVRDPRPTERCRSVPDPAVCASSCPPARATPTNPSGHRGCRPVSVRSRCTDIHRAGRAIDHLTQAERLVLRYLDHVRDHAPVEATRLGLHERDGDLPDLSPASLATSSRDLAVLIREVTGALSAIPADARGPDREARDDLRLLADELAYRRFLLDLRPRYVFDPLAALETISSAIHELLKPGDVSEEVRCRRLEAAARRARRIPVLLEQAGTLLISAPEPHLDVALQRLPALITLVRDELPRRAEQLEVDVSPARDAGEVAAEGLEAYGALLDELREEPGGAWRLGPEDHAITLRRALGTSMDPWQIDARARAWRDEIRAEMAELSASTWSRRFPGEPVPADPTERIRRTLHAVADQAVEPDQLVPEARRAVDEARAFACSAGLTDVPPAERLTLTEVPGYLLGLAVAFITQAPPLEPEAGCTFYLSPVPSHWDADQTRSFLRAYNPAQLRSLAIHEGYPGHFVQLEHASQHARLARRLLSRPAFAEGWAVYIEREALAAGFAEGGSSRVSADDYRITQRKLELRLATDASLDVGLHTGDLGDEQAVDLLVGGALEERREAQGKLLRAKVTAGQLSSYFVGGAELGDLRREVEDREGAAFDPRRFHQRVLSHGTPTVGMIADALADDAPVHRPFQASA